jgi:hypothetical protein
MRALLFLLIIIIVAVILAIATGFLDINRVRGGNGSEASPTGNSGSKPAQSFDVETGSIKLGSKERTVKVPTLVVQKPGERNQTQAATTNNAM